MLWRIVPYYECFDPHNYVWYSETDNFIAFGSNTILNINTKILEFNRISGECTSNHVRAALSIPDQRVNRGSSYFTANDTIQMHRLLSRSWASVSALCMIQWHRVRETRFMQSVLTLHAVKKKFDKMSRTRKYIIINNYLYANAIYRVLYVAPYQQPICPATTRVHVKTTWAV